MVEKCCKTCRYLKYPHGDPICTSPDNMTEIYSMYHGTQKVPIKYLAYEAVTQFCKLDWWKEKEPEPEQKKSPWWERWL